MTRRKIIIGVVIAAVVAAVTVEIYRVHEIETRAELVWHGDEAYLLVSSA